MYQIINYYDKENNKVNDINKTYTIEIIKYSDDNKLIIIDYLIKEENKVGNLSV